jgi:hypothetical protein
MWRQWKTPRRRRAALLEMGVRPAAGKQYCWPRACGITQRPRPYLWDFRTRISNRWASLIVRGVLAYPTRTALYVPVRTVVMQGSAGDRCPYADLTAAGLIIQVAGLSFKERSP